MHRHGPSVLVEILSSLGEAGDEEEVQKPKKPPVHKDS